MRPALPRLGARTELLLLLPAGLLLLVLLSTFTLFSYRSAVELLVEERRVEAGRAARQVGESLGTTFPPSADVLRRIVPQARSVALLDPAGTVLLATEPALAGLSAGAVEEPGTVAATAPARIGHRELVVRVALPATILRSRQRSLEVLAPVVVGVDLGVCLLVLFFIRRLLTPFDRIFDRARRSGRVGEAEDELSFLLRMFDGAVESLTRPRGEDDLEALERALAKSLESGVLLCDRRGEVLALNDTGAALLEVAPDRVAGRPVETALDAHGALADVVRQAVDRGEAVQRQECAVETSRGRRTVGLTVHPLRRDDGAVRGYLILFADLTAAQRQAEEKRLADSLRQLGELAGGVAHELRNGLATLRGYLALAERGGERDTLSEYGREMRRETDHLKRVLDDFLSFARPGRTKTETVDVVRVLHRAAEDPALGGIAVAVDAGAAEAARVLGDPQLLERAFRNLLHNAAEAQREAGRSLPLKVSVRRQEGRVTVLVDDRGTGVPEEVRARLFEPFVSARPGGVGLGLALTRRIVELHGGELTLEPRKRGGTRAMVQLPADQIVTLGNNPGAVGT